MVNEGRRGIDGVVEAFRADSPLDDESRVDSRVGELGLLKLAMGNGVPDSLGGTKRRTAVGKSNTSERIPGAFAAMVTEATTGTARMRNSAGKFVCLFGGRRDRKAEWRAMET